MYETKDNLSRQTDRNNLLDIIKLIASFFVVFIHVVFPEPFGDIIKSFAGFAVPFFL